MPEPLRLVASELVLIASRRRTQALLVVLALVPVLIGAAVRWSGRAGGGDDGGGPPLLSAVTDNGLFLALTALAVSLPVFLPLAVAVVAGESVASEASSGTLRQLLVVPAGRTRVLAVKVVGALAFALAASALVAVVGVVVGLVLFPVGPVVLLSGTPVGYADGLGRLLLVVLFVTGALATVVCLGVLASTLTEVPVAAMAATAVAVVLVQVLGAVPQLAPLHPWLFTSWWTAYADLLRAPLALDGVVRALGVQAGWCAVLLSAAWARLSGTDVTS